MGHWLDALAKASARHRDDHRSTSPISETKPPPGPGRPSSDAIASQAQGLTRRTLLQRSAVVGAGLWATPLLQSALAPAAAASANPCATTCGGTCPTCGPGTGPCSTNTQCTTGLCYSGLCVIPYGATTPCTASVQCRSGNCSGTPSSAGTCLASWPGVTCTADNQCLSGKCNGGNCFENGLGGACRTTTDCTDNTTCGPTKTCGGLGAACANNNKCVSGKCKGGICVS